MKTNLTMILIKKIDESGVKMLHFFQNLEQKKYLPEGKMGFRAFALNSEKGVKTPRWRILGIKKCLIIRSKINFANYQCYVD